MKAAALALAAFTGLPGASTFSYPTASPAPVAWPDSWILLDPRPEGVGLGIGGGLHPTLPDELLAPKASASDEVSQDLVDESTNLPHPSFVGCELTLAGSFTPESWARELWVGAPAPLIVENGHGEKDGRWLEYEQIPRRPGRPDAYLAYRYPLADAPVVSGYDLDKPDDEQRRGRMNAVGHGGVDLVAEMGAPITMVRLEHQRGDAEVLYVGPLYGETVVTRHVLREAGVDRDYVLIFGHLDRAADDVRRGRRLVEGATVGFVGNTASPQLVHLHLEARRLRDHVDAWRLPGDALHAREYSVVTDPRNVLPLRDAPHRSPKCAPHVASPALRYWLGDAMALRLE
jgi:murein DD-endopeptidase MepM/ murein hydrolase activator NlpD